MEMITFTLLGGWLLKLAKASLAITILTHVGLLL